MRRDGEPEPGTLTLEEAHAGVRPRLFTAAEWRAMHTTAEVDRLNALAVDLAWLDSDARRWAVRDFTPPRREA